MEKMDVVYVRRMGGERDDIHSAYRTEQFYILANIIIVCMCAARERNECLRTHS